MGLYCICAIYEWFLEIEFKKVRKDLIQHRGILEKISVSGDNLRRKVDSQL